MASGHALILAKNLVTGNATELTDINGNPIANPDLSVGGNVGYSKPFLLSPKASDLIFTAICQGCEVNIALQMSPDGVHWCDCVLADGGNCTVSCDPLVQDCYTQPIDVGVLQYVRFKMYEVSVSTGNCTIMINYTLN